jgi:hypothetical protein
LRRNDRMVGIGQELWAHACTDCTKFCEEEDGSCSMFSHPGILLTLYWAEYSYHCSSFKCLRHGWCDTWSSTMQYITVHRGVTVCCRPFLSTAFLSRYQICHPRLWPSVMWWLTHMQYNRTPWIRASKGPDWSIHLSLEESAYADMSDLPAA